MPKNSFHPAISIFYTRDLHASIDHYKKVLGFTVNWVDPGVIASISRDICTLMLAQGDQGNPGAWIWIGVKDTHALYEEYSKKGAKIRHPPTNYWWAYEMQIEDLDGNVLRFGSEPKKDKPFGAWLDKWADSWVMIPPGKWTRVKR